MTENEKLILEKANHLSGIEQAEGETFEQTLLRAFERMELRCRSFSEHEQELDERIKEIVNVLLSYGALNYQAKAKVTAAGNLLDGLATGVNMLGEELEQSTISSNEKDILLKEIHHRVKNNLQIISSLLNLQSEQIADEYAREKYKVSRDRILSMALVHEQLYESENSAKIDIEEYVNSLARSLNSSYNPDINRIKLDVEMHLNRDSRFFNIETAIPCGLILNELLSNSFKYAFPGKKKGSIRVRLSSNKLNNVERHELLVEDDGVGLKDGVDVRNTESLGLQLVHMLSDQLNADLQVTTTKGVSFRLVFAGN